MIVIPVSGAQEKLNITTDDVVKRFLNNYPSLNLAQLDIEQARQEFAKIESQLGWILSAQSGISRDVNAFDIPSERFDASAQIGKTYSSGSRFDISGQYLYEESSTSAIPSVANPSERTRLDLNYRIPMGQGEDNPAYTYGKLSALAGLRVTQATQQKQIDALINQVVNLFYDAAATRARISDADKSIERANRLLKFVRKNKSLGLSEKKDILNIQALLTARISERDGLLIAWRAQRSEINKLIGLHYSTEFVPLVQIQNDAYKIDPEELIQRVYRVNSDILLQQAQLDIIKSDIGLARDAQNDKLDLVFSIGARNTSGDSISGSVQNDEWAGGARIEYQYSLDQSGLDADLYQGLLKQDAIQQDIERIKYDLRYQLDRLVEQVHGNIETIKSMKTRLDIENEKVQEAIQRYRVGRSDTRELIDNENTLSASNLAYQTQKIELARVMFELDLLQGVVWDVDRALTK